LCSPAGETNETHSHHVVVTTSPIISNPVDSRQSLVSSQADLATLPLLKNIAKKKFVRSCFDDLVTTNESYNNNERILIGMS
jgi:hypothetical protein